MAMNDFARRMLGFDPLSMFGNDQPGAAMANSPQANTAAIAQPTLEQLYQDDLQRAQMDRVGNLGMLLMAAGQNLTPAQRASILAQAPNAMEGAQRDAMTAAQARLYGMSTRAKQDEIATRDAMLERMKDPKLAASLNATPEMLSMLGVDGAQELIKSNIARNSPESQLAMRIKQAELRNAEGPKIGPIGQDVDGNTIYGDQRTGQPLNIPTSPAPMSGEQPQIPAGVNPREFRKQQAQEAAKTQAAAKQQEEYMRTQFMPAAQDYDAAVRAGIQGGAFGPLQANQTWRSIMSNSDNEALRQRVEQAEKRMAFELAKRASGGKLDSKGLTEGEFENYRRQLIPLYSSNPQAMLDSFEKNYGIQPSAPSATGKLPQGVTIRRLGD